jgi:hypothetical protein
MTIQAAMNSVTMEPWFSALQKATVAFNRIGLKQAEMALLTSGFLTDRFNTYVQHGGDGERLSQKLNELTDRYLETYAGQLNAVRRSWAALCSAWSGPAREHHDRAKAGVSESSAIHPPVPDVQRSTSIDLTPEPAPDEVATDFFAPPTEIGALRLHVQKDATAGAVTAASRPKLRRVPTAGRKAKTIRG